MLYYKMAESFKYFKTDRKDAMKILLDNINSKLEEGDKVKPDKIVALGAALGTELDAAEAFNCTGDDKLPEFATAVKSAMTTVNDTQIEENKWNEVNMSQAIDTVFAQKQLFNCGPSGSAGVADAGAGADDLLGTGSEVGDLTATILTPVQADLLGTGSEVVGDPALADDGGGGGGGTDATTAGGLFGAPPANLSTAPVGLGGFVSNNPPSGSDSDSGPGGGRRKRRSKRGSKKRSKRSSKKRSKRSSQRRSKRRRR
jgi:hypothetical protein